jgi:hypothetical protein
MVRMLFAVSVVLHGREIMMYRPAAGQITVVEYGPGPMVGGVTSYGTFRHCVFEYAGTGLLPDAGVLPT